VTERVRDRVGAAAGANLRVEIRHVPLQRGHRHTERAGDLLVRRSRRHQPQHLQLTSGQAFGGRVARGGPVRQVRACGRRAQKPVDGGDAWPSLSM